MNKRTLQALAVRIQLTKQRLNKAQASGSEQVAIESRLALTVLQSEYLDASLKVLGIQLTDSVFLLSSKHPEGIVLSQDEYLMEVSRMESEDLATHVAVPVDEELVTETTQAIEIPKKGA